jgi:uncharacterized protein
MLFMCSHLSAQMVNETYLEVTGTSEKEITPDNLEITITLNANENVRKDNELQDKEKQIVNALRQFNIPDSAIRIDKIAGHRYGYYKTNSNKYQISKVFKVQLNTTTFLDDLIIRLFETGASNVFISKMTSNSLEKLKIAAAKEALEVAKERAAEMAKTMGIEIGAPIQIKELPAGVIDFSMSYVADRYLYRAQGFSDYQQPTTENLNVRNIILSYTASVRFAIK